MLDYKFLEDMMLEWGKDEIYRDTLGDYIACTDWLVGTFAGRSFSGKTKREALEKMVAYFDETKGTDTVVGNILTKVGWPDLDAIYENLFNYL